MKKILIEISEDEYKSIKNGMRFRDTVKGIMQQIEDATPLEESEDCVSRQAIIDAIDDDYKDVRYSCFSSNNDMECFKAIIMQLPPVTPKPVECGDCISKSDTLNTILKNLCVKDEKYLLTAEKAIYNWIKDMPPVTPKQRTGHWIPPQWDDGMSDPIYYQVRCSECGFDLDPQTFGEELKKYGADRFCPKCGAKMGGEQNG